MTAPAHTVHAIRTLMFLRQCRATKGEIAAQLGVSERAVKRYLAALREAGVHVEVQERRGGSIRGETYNLPNLYAVGPRGMEL